MRLDILRDALLLPASQSAPGGGLRLDARIVQTQQFVQQHDAQCFGVKWIIGFVDLAFELERRLPQIPIEEEQTRLEFDAAKTELGIQQRRVRIDVAIHGFLEQPRLLPAMESAACRDERERARTLALV